MSEYLQKTKPEERNMSGLDAFLLWTGAAISLAEVWAGGFLASLGLAVGIAVIIVGHIIGNTPMALASIIGTREGIPGMVATRPSFGVFGSYFASALNVIQLVGWTAVMIFIAGHACNTISQSWFDNMSAWILIVGACTTLWAVGGHNFWKWFQRVAVTATVILCFVMTYVVFKKYGFSALWTKPPLGGMGFMLGVDLVIAMCLSWVPLVPDYSRFGTDARKFAWGTYVGYFIVSSWMFFTGLLISFATGEATGADPIPAMTALGFGTAALLVVLMSTFTTAFLDIYSTGVSALNIFPKLPERQGVVVSGILGTLVAIVFPIMKYENFLYFIGAFFVPLYAVVITDYFLVKKEFVFEEMFKKGGKYWYNMGFNPLAFAAFIVGFIVYEIAQKGAWSIGCSLPSFVVAGVLYYFLVKAFAPTEFTKQPTVARS